MQARPTIRRGAREGLCSKINARLLAATAALVVGAPACDPHLTLPAGDVLARLDAGGGGGAGGGSGGGLLVSVTPAAPLDGVPLVLRLHAALSGFAFDPTRMMLVQGSVGPGQLTELATGKVSATLGSRLVPTLSWSEGSAEVLAPTAPLVAGALYTLVLGDLPTTVEVTVAATDPVPLLPRVWPPPGASGTAALAVWCGGDADLVPAVDVEATMAPAGLAGHLRTGVVVNGAGQRCVRFEADTKDPGDAGVPPAVPPPMVPSVSDPATIVRLDPRPLQVDGTALPLMTAVCGADEQSFGPGCVVVSDDRLYGRSAPVPLLWAVKGYGADAVVVTAPGDPFVITGLPHSAEIILDVASIDTAGMLTRTSFVTTTGPPRPHVVINEVLAWPLGGSTGEWVEIVNDGHAPAVLDGYVLVVGSGATPLPVATLAPGAFALVVSEAYTPGAPDVAPAPGTLLLQVPHLGKQGLSNEGVALTLLDASGAAISSFPATPKPKQGSSVARRVPSAPDGLPASFALATPSPGQTNTW